MLYSLLFLILLALTGGPASLPVGSGEMGPRGTGARETRAGEMRAIWVTRWDYRSQRDVERIMQQVEVLGATDVIWQVRGQCDAFYRSDIEPWGEELFLDLPAGATDPGFDPLEVAVDEAHRRGLRIHAWFNVFPMWKGTSPPRSPMHALNAHPEWRMRDANEQPQPLNDGYVILNPGLPEVHDHIVRVASDIVRRYDIDGLHLDYVRFVSESGASRGRFPGDAESMRQMRAAMGTTDESPAPGAVRDWLRISISDVVRRLRSEAIIMRSGVEFSAAVWRNPELGRDAYLQDAVLWLAEDVLDRVMPMIYFDDNAMFEADLRAWLRVADHDRVTPGIAAYKHSDPKMTIEQIRLSRPAAGYAVFAYAALFESVDPNQAKDPDSVELRAQRRAALKRFQNPSSGLP